MGWNLPINIVLPFEEILTFATINNIQLMQTLFKGGTSNGKDQRHICVVRH